jgi:NADPH-dependent 2,4-dienoyl-CoA reductase/sulfur reductase-like enzyme/peroxiredoxin family protein/rhodanese-related sulfurtransferase/TusA-related sulfurtransferase
MPDQKRIIIVGGVAGGASAAARARRMSEDAEITLVERGQHVSFANCGMPYHIGGEITDRGNLLIQTSEQLQRTFNLKVRTNTEAVSIIRDRRALKVRDLASGQEEELPYDALILAPGAEPIRPALPGADLDGVHVLRNLSDMDAIKLKVDGGNVRHAVVVGGGYIGLEMAEALRSRRLGVSLVEQASQVMGPADPEMAAWLHQQLRQQGVDLRLNTSVVAIRERVGGLRAELSDGQSLDCGLVIMAVGVRPEVKLAREAGLQLGAKGGIQVDSQMRSSDPAIFAVGDAVESPDLVLGTPALIPLAGPANRQGRVAADAALGFPNHYRATQGTAVCKVFDLTFAMTGASEKALRAAGRAHDKVYVHPASHAHYYPGSTPIRLKLLFDPSGGKILGAQAVGNEGVDKRVDVLATALRGGMTVFDLEELELAYAPPYGSAKDPVNMAGFAAANALRGQAPLAQAAEADSLKPGQALLDVRTDFERQGGGIPGSLHIPLDSLRSRLSELPKGGEILVYCQVGLRGYLAQRILMQHGFKARNLSGGYLTWQSLHGLPDAPRMPLPLETGVAGVPLAQEAADARLELDACGLQCPGPVMRLVEAMAKVKAGEAVRIKATDPGFVNDIPAWAESTGNTLVGLTSEKGIFTAMVRKGGGAAPAPVMGGGVSSKKKSLVVFSGDLDKAIAAFIIANGARSMGSEVTMFFTFWGLNILRKPKGPAVAKTLVEKGFGWMMPKGTRALGMSRMNLAGLGPLLIRWVMGKKNVFSLEELMEQARKSGVRMVACNMSMDIMGIKREELIDGIEEGGVAMYLHQAEQGSVNLFV